MNIRDKIDNDKLNKFIKEHNEQVLDSYERLPLIITTLQIGVNDISKTKELNNELNSKAFPSMCIWEKEGKMYIFVEIYTIKEDNKKK